MNELPAGYELAITTRAARVTHIRRTGLQVSLCAWPVSKTLKPAEDRQNTCTLCLAKLPKRTPPTS